MIFWPLLAVQRPTPEPTSVPLCLLPTALGTVVSPSRVGTPMVQCKSIVLLFPWLPTFLPLYLQVLSLILHCHALREFGRRLQRSLILTPSWTQPLVYSTVPAYVLVNPPSIGNWVLKGIVVLSDFYIEQELKSFNDLQVKFKVHKQQYWRYVQIHGLLKLTFAFVYFCWGTHPPWKTQYPLSILNGSRLLSYLVGDCSSNNGSQPTHHQS